MKTESGFTLVELMVAVLVLTIGLLGLAGLQVKGLSNNHNAYLRTQATLLAQDMADRMRNNQGGLASYLGSPSNNDCASSTCTSTEMAGYDLRKWGQQIAGRLPGASGSISKSANVYTISITWQEREAWKDSAGTTHNMIEKTFSMSFQP